MVRDSMKISQIMLMVLYQSYFSGSKMSFFSFYFSEMRLCLLINYTWQLLLVRRNCKAVIVCAYGNSKHASIKTCRTGVNGFKKFQEVLGEEPFNPYKPSDYGKAVNWMFNYIALVGVKRKQALHNCKSTHEPSETDSELFTVLKGLHRHQSWWHEEQ